MVGGIGPVRVGVVVALAVAFGYIWLLAGRGKWYQFLSRRFIYGVPWGTLVSIVGVIGFYLVVQSGWSHWNSPVTLSFRSWSYFYPEGLLAAGFAHAGPGHLTGNMIGTLVLAPIVEYAWSHYPPANKRSEYEFPPPGEVDSVRDAVPDREPYRNRPWVRAFVIFPAVVVVVSLLTSIFAFGWSLGFSGTVFAFGGFAVVYFPVAAIIAMVGFSGTAILINTVLDPVLRATADPGSPGPPGWWGVNVQAHLLGFLIGVLLALALLKYREERSEPMLVFFSALLFGLSRQLYAFATSPEDDVFLQLRGVGVMFVLGLTILVTAAVAADDGSPLPDVVPDILWGSTMRLVTVGWIAGVIAIGWAMWSGTFGDGTVSPLVIVAAPVLFVLLLFPFLPADGPRIPEALSRRDVLVFALGLVVVVTALPSIASNYPGMADDPVPGEESVTIADYEITYAEDAQHGRIGSNESGVIVVSEHRGIWSSVIDKDELAHDGEDTVVVGGAGWRETVTANRTGWDATGGDSAYVVDLTHNGDTVRPFTSEQAEARAQISNQTIAIVPDEERFHLNVTRDGTQVGIVPIPAVGESTQVDGLRLVTESDDGTPTVFAEQDGTRVQIAQQETFD